MPIRTIEKLIFNRIALWQIRHVKPPDYRRTTGLAADVFAEMRREFQLLPPVTLHWSLPEVMAGAWLVARESIIAGPLSRVLREAIATAVSQTNRCPFCIDVHSGMLAGGARKDVASAIAAGQEASIADPAIRDVVRWTLATRSPDDAILRTPPFAADDVAQIIGTALGFHYINRIAHVFLDDSPIPVPPGLGWLTKPVGMRVAAIVSRRLMQIELEPGKSQLSLPDVPLLKDLSWASSNPTVAGAFARLAAAVDAAGQRWIPDAVRSRVLDRLRGWQGEDPPLGLVWLDEATVDLDASTQPAARLAMLVALAPYRVDQSVIARFREHHPGDEALIATAAWSAFHAAARIGTWLHLTA